MEFSKMKGTLTLSTTPFNGLRQSTAPHALCTSGASLVTFSSTTKLPRPHARIPRPPHLWCVVGDLLLHHETPGPTCEDLVNLGDGALLGGHWQGDVQRTDVHHLRKADRGGGGLEIPRWHLDHYIQSKRIKWFIMRRYRCVTDYTDLAGLGPLESSGGRQGGIRGPWGGTDVPQLLGSRERQREPSFKVQMNRSCCL